MKIAITGAQGVGKTTLAKDIAKATGYEVLPEVARQMISEGYKMDRHVTPEIEYQMLDVQKKVEKLGGNSWIADRCIVDILAYSMVLFKNNKRLHATIQSELKKAKYNIIIYIQPEFPIEDDGVRSTDLLFQQEIDQAVRYCLKEFRYYGVKGGREQRVQGALEIIKTKKNQHDARIYKKIGRARGPVAGGSKKSINPRRRRRGR